MMSATAFAQSRARGSLVITSVSHSSLSQLREAQYGPVIGTPHPRRVMGKSEAFCLCSWGPCSINSGDDTFVGKQQHGPIRKSWSSKQLAGGQPMHELIVSSFSSMK